uniref:Dynactin subunit 2 n=1 Tax=Panagrolaimus superbus TaxID=310955 RepID=A0A914ZF72_9BILA
MSIIKETIYETPDVPEVEELQEPETFENKEVERVHLDVDAALKRFAGRFISSEDSDFSAFEHRRRPKGYSTGHYVIEYVGPEFDQSETPEQKYNRLVMEISELKEQVDNGNENVKPNINLTKEHLDQVMKQLETIILKKANSDTPILKASTMDSNHSTTTPGSSNLDSLMIARFEARVQKLEEALGTVDHSVNEFITPGPLVNAIDDLRLRIESLNPSNLEAIETRLNSALAKQNQIQEKKDVNDELTEQVNEIFKLVNKFRDSSQTVSAVVKRLRALAQIHEQASEFSSKLNELYVTKNNMAESLDANRGTLKEFSDEFKNVIENIRREIEGVRKQIK